jgi:hypothetical protein
VADETLVLFDEPPSALYTLWLAYLNRKSTFVSKERVPTIRVRRPNLRIREKHVKVFYEICEIPRSDSLNILYPFTLVYPYIMRVLCRSEMPLSMFATLNTRNSILYHREIAPTEVMDIECYNCPPRVVPKGLEIDIISEVRIHNEKVWENATTYLVRGNYGEVDDNFSAPRLEHIDKAPVIDQWFLPAKDRFRFARISGDTNGIHYAAFYAKKLGFKRDFAQPIRVVARCVSALPVMRNSGPLRLDFFLKGQVYYQNNLVLKNVTTENADRFDLYCDGNHNPCISGILSSLGIDRSS